jgi:aminoglycoside phosphotransferase family enzyme
MPGKKQGKCSSEQVRKCHGTVKSRSHVCAPDGDPRKCSPEQIRECHGDVKKHPCVGK